MGGRTVLLVNERPAETDFFAAKEAKPGHSGSVSPILSTTSRNSTVLREELLKYYVLAEAGLRCMIEVRDHKTTSGAYPMLPDDPFLDPVHLPVEDVIDLHSVTSKDVKGVVEEYLVEANRLGLKALRIIHGRGIGVQREIVRGVLARTPFVLSYGDAPLEAGGWGATVVTLR